MRLLILAILISSLDLLAGVAHGQQPNGTQPQVAAPQVAEPQNHSYVPDLGDIMETTQFRHFKLWFAGQEKNWNLANFELAQIKKSFDSAAKLYPDIGNIELAKLIAGISEPALAQVGDSIKAQNSAAFARAFGKLTEACNSCHRAAGLDFVVIRVPTSSPFSNQSFAPSRQ